MKNDKIVDVFNAQNSDVTNKVIINDKLQNKNMVTDVDEKFYHASSDVRKIYCTLESHSALDGGVKGGYLTRTFTKVLNNDEFFTKDDLNGLIMKTKNIIKHEKLLGNHDLSGQVIDDVNRMEYFVQFAQNTTLKSSSIALDASNVDHDSNNKKQTFVNAPFSSLTPSIVNSQSNAQPYVVKNPLIVMIGIEYKDMCQEIIYKDYANIKYAFHNICGYDIIYQTNDKTNYYKHLTQYEGSFMKDSKKFKTQWTTAEFDDFNDYVVSVLDGTKNTQDEYDCLMYIISSAGDKDYTIYDSTGEEIILDFTFDCFNNTDCKHLRCKPKIFILNCDRGQIDCVATPTDINHPNNLSSKDYGGDTNEINDTNINNINYDVQFEHNNSWNAQFVNLTRYSQNEHTRFIWANADGFQIIKSGSAKDKGSYLIRNMSGVFASNKTFDKQTLLSDELNDIIMNVKTKMGQVKDNTNEHKLLTQIIEDVHRLPYYVKFVKKQHNLDCN